MTCEVHSPHYRHQPPPRTLEQHHPIPRGWQALWAPQVAPFPGSYAGVSLWDARTITVPPTCHRNVHYLIVRVMHALAGTSGPVTADDVDAAVRAVAAAEHTTPRAPELQCAALAPLRYIAAGGNVRTLIAAGEWGEA